MKIGVPIGNFGLFGKRGTARDQVRVAVAAERLGFDSVWVHDHIVMPMRIRARYPYNESGEAGFAWRQEIFDPIAMMAALAVASLWPAIGRHYWRGTPNLPTLFTNAAFRQVISPTDTVLVLPVGIAGQSMLWNAEADLGFRMASGYVIGPEAPDPYKRFAIYPTLTYGAHVPNQSAAAARFLAAEHVTVVTLDARTAASSVWVPLLERLGWGPTTRDGVVLLRHNGFIAEPVPPASPPRRPFAHGPTRAQAAARRIATEYLRALAGADAPRVCDVGGFHPCGSRAPFAVRHAGRPRPFGG